jgi:SH3-like domain-containing protein
MSRKMIRTLWIITGVFVVLLLAATVYLSREAAAKREAGYSAHIVGLNSVIYLRQDPDPRSHIVTILELGQQVFVTDISDEQVIPWAHVKAGDYEGWVPAERIGVEPP